MSLPTNGVNLPVLDYADIVYDCLTVRDCNELQRLQNYSMRVLLQSGFDKSSSEMHSELELYRLADRRHMHTLDYVYKCVYGLAPERVCSQLHEIQTVHNRQTRATERHNLAMPNFRLDMSRKSFWYRGPFYWNLTDLSIRQTPSLNCFKSSLRRSDMFSMN